MSGFQNQYENQHQIDNDQEIDAFHGSIALLAFFSLPKLFIGFWTLVNHLLNVVVDAIQNGPLIYNQHGQFFEDGM